MIFMPFVFFEGEVSARFLSDQVYWQRLFCFMSLGFIAVDWQGCVLICKAIR